VRENALSASVSAHVTRYCIRAIVTVQSVADCAGGAAPGEPQPPAQAFEIRTPARVKQVISLSIVRKPGNLA
jgi:hypothetical protein